METTHCGYYSVPISVLQNFHVRLACTPPRYTKGKVRGYMHTNANMRGKKIWLQLKQPLQVLHDILMCTMIDEEVQGGLFLFHLFLRGYND
jgi:hypothetical protein